MIVERAPAKVNLTLHVTGQRADGYHLLDSLVVFVDVCDVIEVKPARSTSLVVKGPRADGVPTGSENLARRAADLFDQPVAITLTKTLPAQAGLGGGSADAAATIRALMRLTGKTAPYTQTLLSLGADVPACLCSAPKRMAGIGGDVSPWPNLPPLWAVLVHPGPGASTPAVFKTLFQKTNPPMTPWQGQTPFDWLAHQRNDLQPPACDLVPEIAQVLDALSETHPVLHRMSGSGSACCALYGSADAAMAAASALQQGHPAWWVASGRVLSA